jgi:hypothetical protein
VLFVSILIWQNIRAKKDAPGAILLRILTNYFQIITSASYFNLTFPSSLEGLFSGVRAVGESARIFLSVDCFIQDFAMVESNNTTEYFKAFMSSLTPIIFTFVVVCIWLIIKAIKRYTLMEFKNRVIISLCVVLFLLHPSITGMAMGLFNCYEIDNGEYWLFKDLSIKCWTSGHQGWAFGLGLLMIIFWVLGLPFAGYLIVRHYKERLDDPVIVFRYRILYQGFKEKEAYYWEFVNVFRKVSIVMINIFLGIYPPIYKTFVATLTLAIILRQQEQIQPYKVKVFNECEFRESITSIVTLFGGMFFILEDLPAFIKVLLVLVIFLCNLLFYALWIHLYFKRSRFASIKLMAIFFGKISCLGKDYWEEERKTLQSEGGFNVLFGDGKYDAKETKYKQIDEKEQDSSIQGYAPQANIQDDLSAGGSNTGSLVKQGSSDKEKKKGKGSGDEKPAKASPPPDEKPKRKKGRKGKKKKKVVKKKKKAPKPQPEQDSVDNPDLDIPDDPDRVEAHQEVDDEPADKDEQKETFHPKDEDKNKKKDKDDDDNSADDEAQVEV